MKMKKIIALMSSIAMTSSIMAMMSVNALASDLPVELKLQYNAETSTGTTKAIDVYYDGDTLCDFTTLQFNLVYPADVVSSAAVSHDLSWNNVSNCVDVNSEGYYAFIANMVNGAALSIPETKIATITLNVAEGTDEFEVYVDCLEGYSTELDADYTMGNIWYYESGDEVEFNNHGKSTLTIPGATVEEPEEEPVVINAEDAGMFTYWQDAPVAQAFFANLTAEQAAKDSIVWTVTDGTPDKTKTEVANIDTEVSGESGVVLGLVVSNAVEGLTATVTVK